MEQDKAELLTELITRIVVSYVYPHEPICSDEYPADCSSGIVKPAAPICTRGYAALVSSVAVNPANFIWSTVYPAGGNGAIDFTSTKSIVVAITA